MTYRAPVQNIQPLCLQSEPRTSPDIFGLFFAEIVPPDGQPRLPELHGWELRLWPVARLGDATLEARPLYPLLNAEHLRDDLKRRGVSVLGPIREKR